MPHIVRAVVIAAIVLAFPATAFAKTHALQPCLARRLKRRDVALERDGHPPPTLAHECQESVSARCASSGGKSCTSASAT